MRLYTLIILLVFVYKAGFSQSTYKVIRTKLPQSDMIKEYFVKQVGNHYILNGDIIVGTTGQNLLLYQSNNHEGGYIWPKGYVPVKIDKSMQQNKTKYGKLMYENALNAIEEINKETNIRLVPYTNQKDYIRIMHTTDTGFGGLSPIGRKGGEQIIYISTDSDIRTIIHELLHSLGFWHEHSRHDRNNFIAIDTNNVIPEFRHNFQIEPGAASTTYDYNSIMHYSGYAFALNKQKPTIQCKKNNVLSDCVLKEAEIYFSNLDVAGINSSYWFNRDVAKVNYTSSLPYDEYIPTEKIVKSNPVLDIHKETRDIEKKLEDAVYMIKVFASGKYLSVAGASTSNGALLHQSDKTGASNQQFEVRGIGNSLYQIKAVHSNKYLNVIGQSTKFRAGICQWDFINQDNLKFYLNYKASHKGYTIQGLQSGMNWVVLSKDNGSEVVQDNLADVFIFEKVGNIAPLSIFKEEGMKRLPLPTKH